VPFAFYSEVTDRCTLPESPISFSPKYAIEPSVTFGYIHEQEYRGMSILYRYVTNYFVSV